MGCNDLTLNITQERHVKFNIPPNLVNILKIGFETALWPPLPIVPNSQYFLWGPHSSTRDHYIKYNPNSPPNVILCIVENNLLLPNNSLYLGAWVATGSKGYVR